MVAANFFVRPDLHRVSSNGDYYLNRARAVDIAVEAGVTSSGKHRGPTTLSGLRLRSVMALRLSSIEVADWAASIKRQRKQSLAVLCQRRFNSDPPLECAPSSGHLAGLELTRAAGLSEDDRLEKAAPRRRA